MNILVKVESIKRLNKLIFTFILCGTFILLVSCNGKKSNDNNEVNIGNNNINNNLSENILNNSQHNNSNNSHINNNFTIDVTDPIPPKLKSWTCLEGWEKVVHDGVTDESGDLFSWCEPNVPRLKSSDYITPLRNGEIEGERPVCDPGLDGTFPLIGKTTCQPIGTTCNENGWPTLPEDTNAENVIYVNANAESEGNGSLETPYKTIASALTAATDGSMIVLKEGHYLEKVIIEKNITLLGSCPQKTLIEAPGPHTGQDTGVIIIGSNTNVIIQNLKITGNLNGVYINNTDSIVNVINVWIHKTMRYGILVLAGELNTNNVLIDSVQSVVVGSLSSTDGGTRGRGIGLFSYTGKFEGNIKDTTIEFCHDMGISATRVTADDDPVGTLELENIIVRNTVPRTLDNMYGLGINIGGPVFNAKNLLIENNYLAGFQIQDQSTTGNIEHATIKNTLPTKNDNIAGFGIQMLLSGKLNLKNVLITDCYTSGIIISDESDVQQNNLVSSINVKDVIIDKVTGLEYTYFSGKGFSILNDISNSDGEIKAEVDGLLIENTKGYGLNIEGPNANATIEDLIVRKTYGHYDSIEEFGWGIVIHKGADLDLERAIVEFNHDVGILTDGETTKATILDLKVNNTMSNLNKKQYGVGIIIQSASFLDLKKALLKENHTVGLLVIDNSELLLENIKVIETNEASCAFLPLEDPNSCLGEGIGYGIASISNSIIKFSDIIVKDNATLGIQIAREGILSGNNIEVTNHPIAFNIQKTSDNYVFNEEVTGLVMKDNVINFDSQELKVPEIISN